MIVSPHHEAIRQSVLAQMGRGVTAFKAEGGYTEVEPNGSLLRRHSIGANETGEHRTSPRSVSLRGDGAHS